MIQKKILQVKSLTGIAKTALSESSNPLMRALDRKYTLHGDLDGAMRNVSRGEVVLVERYQAAAYRIGRDFTDE